MSVGLLIITHDGIGAALLETAKQTLDQCPLPVQIISAARDCDPDLTLEIARKALTDLDQGQGVLVLTDLYGSTPSNIATRLIQGHNIRIVTGINLPMLIRVLNYCHLDLDKLLERAVSGGCDGVFAIAAEK